MAGFLSSWIDCSVEVWYSLKKKSTRFVFCNSKMMVPFDVWNFNKVLFKECRPVVDGHNYPAIVSTNELGLVNSSRAGRFDHLSKFIER